MKSKFTVPKIILHNLFIIAAYAISLFVCLFVPMKLFFIFFVPFNFIFQGIFLFLFDAVVYTILNRMPFVRGLHYFLFHSIKKFISNEIHFQKAKCIIKPLTFVIWFY